MGQDPDLKDWHEWLSEWGDRFLLFARQQTRSLEDAEDALQEAFVQIWSRRERFPRIEPGLFFTQIRRCAIDQARKHHRRSARESAYARECASWFLENPGQGTSSTVAEHLQSLPPEQQEVLVLKIWGGQTFESIGKTLDISPNTAASRYRYGLENLRKSLETGTTK